MPSIGPMEIAIVLIIALVVFGPRKLPELGSSLGKGIREFKGSISGDGDSGSKPETDERERRPALTASATTEAVSDAETVAAPRASAS